MASMNLRKFSACLVSSDCSSSFESLVTPSTRSAISRPKSFSISAWVAARILDRVVQQRRHDRGIVELQVRQDACDLERMREIGVA
jgi:hypothetical protein